MRTQVIYLCKTWVDIVLGPLDVDPVCNTYQQAPVSHVPVSLVLSCLYLFYLF